MTVEARHFLRGVNYWPARSAMAWWRAFDAGEVDEDFARIAGWGLDQVRIFLLWEDFQPQPDAIADSAVADLSTVLDVAVRHGLGVVPALFCGHMSGVNWLPDWAIAGGGRSQFPIVSGGRAFAADAAGAGDIYADEALVEAQLLLARRLVERLGGHPGLAGWDLGNESSNVAWPGSPQDAARWSARISEALAPSGVPITGGLQAADIEQDRRIRPGSIAAPWAFVAMHAYPIYSPAALGPDDPHWVSYVCRLAAHLTDKPVTCHEFGLPDHELGEERVARYAALVLDELWSAGVLGAFAWCYADYRPALASVPPFDHAAHELHFGMVRHDGRDKPIVAAWRDFGRRPLREPPTFDGPSEAELYTGLPDSLIRHYRAWRAELAA